MEARCPRGPGAATTATPQGARTPNWPTQCYHCMEGWEGLLETSKPSKNHPQPQNCNKNTRPEPKPHAKQSKPINVHIPVLKILIDPIRRREVEHTEVSWLFQISGGT